MMKIIGKRYYRLKLEQIKSKNDLWNVTVLTNKRHVRRHISLKSTHKFWFMKPVFFVQCEFQRMAGNNGRRCPAFRQEISAFNSISMPGSYPGRSQLSAHFYSTRHLCPQGTQLLHFPRKKTLTVRIWSVPTCAASPSRTAAELKYVPNNGTSSVS